MKKAGAKCPILAEKTTRIQSKNATCTVRIRGKLAFNEPNLSDSRKAIPDRQYLPPSKIQRLGLNPVSQTILQPNFATCRFPHPFPDTQEIYWLPVLPGCQPHNPTLSRSVNIVAHFLLQKAFDSLSLSLFHLEISSSLGFLDYQKSEEKRQSIIVIVICENFFTTFPRILCSIIVQDFYFLFLSD